MVVLENGHYYQVRITPRPLARQTDLESVDSMLPRDKPMPDCTTTLPSDQSPDPLSTILSGRACSWHPGHVHHCLWWWAPRRWQHIRERSAAQRFHVDGRPATRGGHPAQRTGEPPHNSEPLPRLCDAPDPGVGVGTGVAHHPHGERSVNSTCSPREGALRRPSQRPCPASGQPHDALTDNARRPPPLPHALQIIVTATIQH